ncbi:MAG: YdeI/OmpD-associated family protein [Cyclobacteriaceae bacterium]
MAIRKDIPDFYPETRQQWREWLAENHADTTGIWLIYYKKHTGMPSVTYNDAVEEALCFGWIDSVVNKLDTERTKQYFSPRKPQSSWSKSNKDRIIRLLASNSMAEAGLAKIAVAKQDGSWTRYDAVEALEIPDDLQQALEANPAARQHFEAFAPSARKIILWWIISARRPETRQKRIDKTVAMAAQNRKANSDR